MKKLNREGFTLIELLAIIVILAIIMVVTIPTVLSSLGSARRDTFDTSANTAADFIEKEYVAYKLNPSDTTLNSTLGTNLYSKTAGTSYEVTDNTVRGAMGLKGSNYSLVKVTIYSNGRACVKLTPNTSAGDFKSLGSSAVACSSACKSTDCTAA